MIANLDLREFSEQSNIMINQAIVRANSFIHKELNTLHLALTLLEYEDILEGFKELTWIEECEYFKQDIQRELGKISTCSSDNTEHRVIGNELALVIENASSEAQRNGRKLIPSDLLNSLLYTKDTLFYDLMLGWGIDTTTTHYDTLHEQQEEKKEELDECYKKLEEFGINMNKLAEEGKIETITSREDTMRSIIETLGRKNKANPCLVGDPGVGKTAIVEALVARINSGDVPEYLRGSQVYRIDIPDLVAGCTLRGQLEERLKQIIRVASECKNAILFFDEIHMIMSIGGNESSINGANILKPVLARGEIRIIGATTRSEYNMFIGADAAFERRLRPIVIEEPTVDECIEIINECIGSYENYHGIEISNKVIESAVKLSDRYITHRKLPDKAISIIDETAARIKATSVSTKMTEKDIKETIYKLTGIDMIDLNESDTEKLLKLEERLCKNVIGQEEAIKEIVQAIKRNKVGLVNKNKPIGSFLFVGPTGVGKTQLCKMLAKEMFGAESAIIRFDMSEYMEKHSISKLIGSPPGYKGHRNGGLLTEKIKNNPYSIVLLDEIEKAHEDILDIFLQVLDDGILTDGKGETIDFKNTIIILTSNCGYENMFKKGIGFTAEALRSTDKSIKSKFKAEILNRLDKVITFNSLSKDNVKILVKKEIGILVDALKERGMIIEVSEEIVDEICYRSKSEAYGARDLQRLVQDIVENKLCDLILSNKLKQGYSTYLDYINGEVTHTVIGINGINSGEEAM